MFWNKHFIKRVFIKSFAFYEIYEKGIYNIVIMNQKYLKSKESFL